MADDKKSVDEILKDIVIEAVNEYLERPTNKDMPKDNTQSNITRKTGIPAATLSRYLNSESKSYPNLVEAMEILSVIGKRDALLKFAEKSNCQAARFIKSHYRQYLEMSPIGMTEEQSTSGNEEILRMTTESHKGLEKRIKKENLALYWMLIGAIALAYGLLRNTVDDIGVKVDSLVKDRQCMQSEVKKVK